MTDDVTREAVARALMKHIHHPPDAWTLADAAIAAYENSRWRPISEANRDSDILAYFGPYLYVARWRGYRLTARAPKSYWSPLGCLMGETWARKNQPTHYMAIPSPPVTIEKGQ